MTRENRKILWFVTVGGGIVLLAIFIGTSRSTRQIPSTEPPSQVAPARSNVAPPTSLPSTTDGRTETDRIRRAQKLRLLDRSLTEPAAMELVERSDRFREETERQGLVDLDLELRHEIRDTTVTDAELRRYFEEHRSHFGERTFEESRRSLEQLVRLERVLGRYEGVRGPSEVSVEGDL